jgi:hypothetical protein
VATGDLVGVAGSGEADAYALLALLETLKERVRSLAAVAAGPS